MYNLLIFITKKTLQGVYLKDKTMTPISIDGNLKITITSIDSLKRLVTAVEETFNVDELSQAELTVTIMNCCADNEYVDNLYNLFSCISSHSVLKAENIIPFILDSSDFIKMEDEQVVSVLDCYYQLEKKDDSIQCVPINETKSAVNIPIEYFSILFSYERSAPNIAELQAINNKQTEKIAELEERTIKDQEKLEIQEGHIAELKKKINYQNNIKSEILSNRRLVYLYFTDRELKSTNSDYFLNKLWFLFSAEEKRKGLELVTCFAKLDSPYSDKDPVQEGMVIVNVNLNTKNDPETFSDDIKKEIRAPSSGIFYKFFNTDIIEISFRKYKCTQSSNQYMSEVLPIGVIVDRNDPASKKEIIQWFQMQKNNDFIYWEKNICDHCFYDKVCKYEYKNI